MDDREFLRRVVIELYVSFAPSHDSERMQAEFARKAWDSARALLDAEPNDAPASSGGVSPCGGCSPESTSDYTTCAGCEHRPDDDDDGPTLAEARDAALDTLRRAEEERMPPPPETLVGAITQYGAERLARTIAQELDHIGYLDEDAGNVDGAYCEIRRIILDWANGGAE